MLSYVIRPRAPLFDPPEAAPGPDRFPADAELTVTYEPEQPFGVAPKGGRTVVSGAPNSIQIADRNTGQVTFHSDLTPLALTIFARSGTWTVDGNKVTYRWRCESLVSLYELADTVLYVLPSTLSIAFIDAPHPVSLTGTVAGVPFRWVLVKFSTAAMVTTQAKQTERAGEAIGDLYVIAEQRNRRLAAALQYFHVARRLIAVSASTGEFVAEVVLNLAKVLLVLFPGPDKGCVDRIKGEIRALNYPEQYIDRWITRVIYVRNELDSGHPMLSVMSREQLAALHEFTDNIELVFEELLRRIVRRVDAGTFTIAPAEATPHNSSVMRHMLREPGDTASITREQQVVYPAPSNHHLPA